MHPKIPYQLKYDMIYIVFHAIVDFDINGSKVKIINKRQTLRDIV